MTCSQHLPCTCLVIMTSAHSKWRAERRAGTHAAWPRERENRTELGRKNLIRSPARIYLSTGCPLLSLHSVSPAAAAFVNTAQPMSTPSYLTVPALASL